MSLEQSCHRCCVWHNAPPEEQGRRKAAHCSHTESGLSGKTRVLKANLHSSTGMAAVLTICRRGDLCSKEIIIAQSLQAHGLGPCLWMIYMLPFKGRTTTTTTKSISDLHKICPSSQRKSSVFSDYTARQSFQSKQ